MGQAKEYKTFEQVGALFALVCGEATGGGDKASASCDFGRNWRRAVSTYAPRQLPKGGTLFLSGERNKVYEASNLEISLIAVGRSVGFGHSDKPGFQSRLNVVFSERRARF